MEHSSRHWSLREKGSIFLVPRRERGCKGESVKFIRKRRVGSGMDGLSVQRSIRVAGQVIRAGRAE